MVTVEVVYAPEGAQIFRAVEAFKPGMTVSDALRKSGIFERYPETEHYAVGIFSVLVTHEASLTPGARIEVYRPLQVSPKERRRRRAKAR